MGGRCGSRTLTRALLATGAALAVAQGGPGLTALAPVRRLFPGLAGAGRTDHVALTFDDGPDPRFTPRFLAMLAARRVHATFFLLGPMVSAAPGLAAEIAAAGHQIGVHGVEHRYATLRGPGALHDDLARACDTIAAATGAVPGLYSPALRGAQRRGPDRRPPPRAAADPVEYLGTGVGPRGHAGLSAGDPGPHPGRRGHRALARFRSRRPGGNGRGRAGRAALAAGRVRRARAAGRPAHRASGPGARARMTPPQAQEKLKQSYAGSKG